MRLPSLTILILANVTVVGALAQDGDFEFGALPPPNQPAPLHLNQIEVGFGTLTSDSYALGRYGGLRDSGPFTVFTGRFMGGAAWDAATPTYWRADFNLLGAETQHASLGLGQQGKWGFSSQFDGFTRAFTETASSPYRGIGTDRLTLPSDWFGAVRSSLFSAIPRSLKPIDLQTKWQHVDGDFVLYPLDDFEFRLHLEHREREGLRPSGIAFGHEGDFPVGTFFPLPVDFASTRLGGSFGYSQGKTRIAVHYEFAAFTNRIDSVTVTNPYSRSIGPGWPAGAFAGYPFAIGQYALPPDTSAHNFAIDGNYVLSPSTRITGRLSYVIQKQNDPFFPYTANPLLLAPQPLPRSSLDGDVRKTVAHVALTSRPSPRFDVNFRYALDDRNNRTPQDLYTYVPNDAQDQPAPFIPGVSRYIRYNLPHSFTFHSVNAEAAYRTEDRTRVSVSYTGTFKARDDQQVRHTREHAVRAKISKTFEMGSGWIAAHYAERDGSDYDDAAAWDASHTDAYLQASPFNQSIEHPLLRKYNLADRRRTEVKAGATWQIGDTLTADASGSAAKDSYNNSPLGLRRASWALADLNLSFVPSAAFSTSMFYNFERIRSRQRGYYIVSLDETNPDQEWTAQNTDTIHTVGGRFIWSIIPGTFEMDAVGTMAWGNTNIVVQSTPFFPLAASAPLPAATDTAYRLQIGARYLMNDSMSVRLKYIYDRRYAADWQYDDVGLASVSQLLGSGILPPHDNVHAIVISLTRGY